MKKSIITAAILLLILSLPADSHPLDISLTTLQILPTGFYGTTYIHPYELSLLVEEHGLSLQESDIDELKKIIFSYFKERFKVYGRSGLISKENITLENDRLYQILASGMYINYIIRIKKTQYPITFKVDMFCEYFNTQTNKLVLLDGAGNLFPGSKEIILTTRRTEWSFDLNNPDFSAEVDDLKDSDGDGFTDHLEKLYGLNPNNPDTDGDEYSDFIEFSFGWDPFDKKPSPGQSWEVVMDSGSSDSIKDSTDQPPKDTKDTIETMESSQPVQLPNLIKEHNIRDKKIPDSSFLERVLSKIEKTSTAGFSFGSLLSVLISVFALGFLHASMPGHGKGILLSYLTKENRKFRHAMGFILTFSITHLIDVIILSFGFKLLSSTSQSARVSQMLKFIGGSGLIVIALFMIVTGIRDIKKPADYTRQPENSPRKTKGAVVMGFLTGLAPCPFGWAILMMLLSLNKAELIPLIIAFFGLGIFVFLFFCTLGVFLLRYVILDLFSRFSRYSQLISGVLLLIFAVFFFTSWVPSL